MSNLSHRCYHAKQLSIATNLPAGLSHCSTSGAFRASTACGVSGASGASVKEYLSCA